MKNKTSCRNFIKDTGLSGAGVLSSFSSKGLIQSTGETADEYKNRIKKIEKNHVQRFNMSGYAAPVIETVHVGIIGLGNRGPTYYSNNGAFERGSDKGTCLGTLFLQS